jgi:hypothetical protein
MQAHQLANSTVPRIVDEIVKSTLASGCIDPFLQCASRKVTVVVDERSPSRHDIESSVSVPCDSRRQRPESILLISKNRSRVVSDHVLDSIIHPSLNSIRVMETSNRGRDDAIVAKAFGLIQPNLLQPSSVEGYLLRCI